MDLLGKSVKELKNLIEKKEVTPKEVWKYFLLRIKKNSKLNTFLLEAEFKPTKQGDLFGIPLSFKDNFCTLDMRTTASSKVLENFIPPYNATVVERLTNSGAGVLGKTNMDAWAHGSSTETSDFGPTRNPWDID